MRHLFTIGLISGLISLFGCSSNPVENEPIEENPFLETLHPKENPSDLKVGGVYWVKIDTTYYVQKILAIDDFAIHHRWYENKFKVKPTQINTDTLKIMIGHAPIDKKGFLQDNPELLKVEEVK